MTSKKTFKIETTIIRTGDKFTGSPVPKTIGQAWVDKLNEEYKGILSHQLILIAK